MVKKKPSWSQTVKHGSPTNQFVTTRNLQSQDLGAVIFGCTNNTFAECHTRQLFGLPRAHLSYVQNIKEGLPLFLFNYDNRTLHGIYEAASNGKFCPQSNAWSRNGKEKTQYPAQVAMRLKLRCIPLAENQFRNAILTNYYQRMPDVLGQMRLFHFELDHAQTCALMNMFTPFPSRYNLRAPPVAAPVHEHVRKSTLRPILAPELEGNCGVNSENAVKPYSDAQKKELEEVGYVGVNAGHAITTKECSSGFNDLDCGDTPLEGRDHALSNNEAKLQQQQSGQEDKMLTLELGKLKMLCPQQHSSEFYANATATADIDAYSCKDAQEVKSTSLDGPPDSAENFNAEVNRLSWGYSNPPVESLDLNLLAEAKMMNRRCTIDNQLSPSPSAITQQFQETETKLVWAEYETPKYINDNGALEATDPSGHRQSSCAESTSIRPLSISSSQECMRDENSSTKGRKRKSCHDEIHNKHQTELPSPDCIGWYLKDKLIGKITCMVCGEQGHYTCHCPMKDRENKVMCTLCNKVGHCYLWCCQQHLSENRACRRCGEKGHYTNKDLSHCDKKYNNMYIRCSSCDDSHSLGRCPMGKVTCFLCEGKDHVPAHCRLSPVLTVTQDYRQIFQSILKEALAETSRRAVTPAKPSSELEPNDDNHESQIKRNGEMVHSVSSMIHCEQGACTRNNATKSVQFSDKTNHAVLTEKVLTRGSRSACFNCNEEGHYARSCPKKKPPGELVPVRCAAPRLTCGTQNEELTSGGETVADCGSFGSEANTPLDQHDVTNSKFRPKKNRKKTTDITCFYCHDKGHYSHSCPVNTVNKTPGGLELHDVTCIIHCERGDCMRKNATKSVQYSDKTNTAVLTEKVLTGGSSFACINCHEGGHYARSCPKKSPGKLGPVWCGDEAAAPRLTCGTQNEKLTLGGETLDWGGFGSEANTPVEQHDITYSKFRTKKKKTANITCYYCHDKGHYSHCCPVIANTVNKTPGGLELHDVTCFKCHDKGHYSYSCPKNELPGQCHGEGHSAKMCPTKQQKEQQK